MYPKVTTRNQHPMSAFTFHMNTPTKSPNKGMIVVHTGNVILAYFPIKIVIWGWWIGEQSNQFDLSWMTPSPLVLHQAGSAIDPHYTERERWSKFQGRGRIWGPIHTRLTQTPQQGPWSPSTKRWSQGSRILHLGGTQDPDLAFKFILLVLILYCFVVVR